MELSGDRLARLLGGEDLAWLLARARQRLERDQDLDGTVTLTGATPSQRSAAQRLLGRPPRPGAALSVSLPAVDEVLRRSGACPDGLAAAVVALTGPVTSRSVADAEQRHAWDRAFAPLFDAAPPELHDWVEWLRGSGLVRRLAGDADAADPLLSDLAAVITALPADGEPLGAFAARITGDAHALDDDRPLATLALGAARTLAGLPVGTGAGVGAGAQWRREVWAAVGVLRDELSTTVLTFGLPGDIDSATGRALSAWREAGQPVALTLRQLVRDPPRLAVTEVWVCENPVVLAAAAQRLGTACAPLVCTSGQPGAAVMHLLRALAGAGTSLRHHGDYDWGGLRIGNVLHARLPVRPWRYDTAAYRAATRGGAGRSLTGPPVTASWDPELTGAMQRARRAVEEELLLDDLLEDLALP
ncbi:MAG: TIGR02679 family protein [Pseudonocardiaceae bacterium]